MGTHQLRPAPGMVAGTVVVLGRIAAVLGPVVVLGRIEAVLGPVVVLGRIEAVLGRIAPRLGPAVLLDHTAELQQA